MLGRAPCGFNRKRHIIGDSVSATNADTSTQPASVMPNSRNSLPVRPDRKISGRNTAASAMVVDITAK